MNKLWSAVLGREVTNVSCVLDHQNRSVSIQVFSPSGVEIIHPTGECIEKDLICGGPEVEAQQHKFGLSRENHIKLGCQCPYCRAKADARFFLDIMALTLPVQEVECYSSLA
jgi:hypothetical protein